MHIPHYKLDISPRQRRESLQTFTRHSSTEKVMAFDMFIEHSVHEDIGKKVRGSEIRSREVEAMRLK